MAMAFAMRLRYRAVTTQLLATMTRLSRIMMVAAIIAHAEMQLLLQKVIQ